MTGRRLVLIGTVHRDPLSETHLAGLLETLHPARLTLEMSPAALRFRQTRGVELNARLDALLQRLAAELRRPRETLEHHPEVPGIRRLLALPYEYRVAAAWAQAAAIPLELIDQNEISWRKLRRVERELVTLANLRTLLRLETEATTGEQEDYRLARALVLGNPLPQVVDDFLARRRGEEGIGSRDGAMAATLRRSWAGLEEGCLVHIGGWVHLLDDPRGESLYSRLRDLGPERMLAG